MSLPWVCHIAFWTDLHFWHLDCCLAEFPQCMYSGKKHISCSLVSTFLSDDVFSWSLVFLLLEIRNVFYSYIPCDLNTQLRSDLWDPYISEVKFRLLYHSVTLNTFISQKTIFSSRKIIFTVCLSYSQKREIYTMICILTVSNLLLELPVRYSDRMNSRMFILLLIINNNRTFQF